MCNVHPVRLLNLVSGVSAGLHRACCCFDRSCGRAAALPDEIGMSERVESSSGAEGKPRLADDAYVRPRTSTLSSMSDATPHRDGCGK